MKLILTLFLTLLTCFSIKAQITLTTDFTNNSNRKQVMQNHLDTYNRIHPVNGVRQPIIANSGIGVVRPLGGISSGGQADLSKDSYLWNGTSFVTDFSSLETQIDKVLNAGFDLHQIVLDNPSWAFQRDNRGNLPGGNYVVSTYGNAMPPRSNTRWANYLKEAMRAIVAKLGEENARKIQYGIGREIGTSGHWSGTQAQFFEFYRVSVNAILEVLPNAKVGSHFLWGSASNSWATDFLGYCKRRNVPYDFVGISYYPFYNRADRTNFDEVYNKDFGVVTRNRNWNSNAKLEVHEFALIKSLSSAGNSFDSADPRHQNSFVTGMMKMFYQNQMNNLTFWGTGSQYNPAIGELLKFVGYRYYRNSKSGNQRSNGNYVNAIFANKDNKYRVMAYNYNANVSQNNGNGVTERLRVRAIVNHPPGTRYRYRTISYNRFRNTKQTSAFREATTNGRSGSGKSTIALENDLLGYSFYAYEIEVIGGSGGQTSTPTNNNTGNITGSWYKIKNKFTNRYLDGNNATLTSSSSQSGFDKQFQFISRGNYYNIDIRKSFGTGTGILRATNDSRKSVIVTDLSPRFDNDKQFTVTRLSGNTYTIKSRARNAYMQEANNAQITTTTNNSTNRTKWLLERVGNVSKTSNNSKTTNDVEVPFSVYPNPSSSGIFELNQATPWEVYNIRGQKILSGNTTQINLSNKNRGIYLLKVEAKTLKLIY
ncbi:GH39 family glycosyl hydrolase [Hyunsoonleella sp. 2307UL5-6]|uniref:GH39 family glycosyl hydrolase n=1 Tax=Hyunsoonleella sp. 2307UL5-6 TaxID=3384768 RepID=UPI0039BCF614